jgi:hypothetical protein
MVKEGCVPEGETGARLRKTPVAASAEAAAAASVHVPVTADRSGIGNARWQALACNH